MCRGAVCQSGTFTKPLVLCINKSNKNTKISKVKLEACVCIAPIKLVKILIKGVAAGKVVFFEDSRLAECSTVSLSQFNEIVHMICFFREG